MTKMNIFEYVGLATKHLAMQGLSWSYSCVYECGHYTDFSLGEGEMIIYYNGFDYKQLEHGRMTFVREENVEEDIALIASWGVQGPGEHFRIDSIHNPTEKQIEDVVRTIADYLREKRIPVEP